jgi:hypothetical protein
MCDIIKNSGKEQTFHGESVAREHVNDKSCRFLDLIVGDITEKTLLVAAVAGVTYGPNLAQIRSEREWLLREKVEKEGTPFDPVMEYACQTMWKSINSTTAKETTIVEEKVTTTEGSMTNRIMFTRVMVAGEKGMNTQPQQPSQNSNGHDRQYHGVSQDA